MEIKITSRQILQVLNIVSWIIFIGICIDAGGYLVSSFYWFFFKPAASGFYWNHLGLLPLYEHDKGHFLVLCLFLCIVAVLKAIIFYRIVKLLQGNKLNMAQPFTREVGRFLFITAWLTLMVGFFCVFAGKYTGWLSEQALSLPTLQDMQLAGADVWFFMGITLLMISYIFKRGIELQAENDLTI